MNSEGKLKRPLARPVKALICLPAVCALLSAACQTSEPPPPPDNGAQNGAYKLTAPAGLDLESSSFHLPPDNALTEEKIKLGKRLYFEKALSTDHSISCASCHAPEHGFADPRQFSVGVGGKKGGRQAPTVINRAFSRAQFWDGRVASLEEQALGPITNPVEMAHPNIAGALARLKVDVGYIRAFKAAFPAEHDAITPVTLSRAIASFERTVMSGNSAYDKFAAGDQTALSAAAQRGLQLFNSERTQCATCHASFNFTDENYHNIGSGLTGRKPDIGRHAITKLDGHQGAFKTPTLRQIAATAPYMSDGSLKTLAEVVAFYDQGGKPNKWLSPKIKPLKLSGQEKRDLVEFMKSLSGEVVWYGKEEDLRRAANSGGRQGM